jgi:glycosyltransferase involved in cell wall biosynthesis
MLKVSVIIPLYNGEKYIAQTLRSVFAQTLLPSEIIVVNDGSSDNSPEMVDGLKLHAPCPLHLIFQTNAGTQAARNAGITNATSPYVALLDQDDFWDNSFLAETSRLVALNRVVYSSYQNVNVDGLPVGKVVHPNPKHFGIPRLLLGNQVFPSLALLPREKLLEAGLFDTAFLASGDWDMWLRLVLRDVQFVHLKKTLVNYRLHPQNTSKNQRLMLNDHRGVVQKTLNYPNLPRRLLSFRHKILASDHLYAATRLWRIYAATPSDGLKAEMRNELKEAIKHNPQADFWAIVLTSMAANGSGKPLEAIGFAVQVLAEDLVLPQKAKLTALESLLTLRYSRNSKQIPQVILNSPKIAPFVFKFARRRFSKISWIEEL